MQPNPDQSGAGPQEAAERAAALQAALTTPLPDQESSQNTQMKPSPYSQASERAALDLLATVTMRVDQIARADQERWAQVDSVLDQMVKTMQLAQVMIAQIDQVVLWLREQGEKQGQVTEALIKVNSNLSEVIAALLAADQPQKV